MSTTTAQPKAADSGTFLLGGNRTVHRMGFGAMRVTGPGIWGEPRDPAEAKRVLRRAVELGVSFIDTANSYGPEVSERLIAEALHPYRGEVVIATKGGLTRQGPERWAPVGRAEYLRECVEMSLRRLRLDCIELYQLHRIDPKVPVEESLGALKEMQREGKIRHIGLSEVSVPELERAQKIVAIVSVQNLYNIGNRQSEAVLAYCEQRKLAFIPWFPMAGGDLVQPGGVLDTAAKRHGASVSQIALAWLLHRSPVMLPIPGTSSVAHLEENVAASSLRLAAAEWREIEQAVGPAAASR
ncbi:MAG TPA: aldo/keto reductase [Opitutaceae bacterium]|nr:aldo/keto reductase [Opitutaceae bacterium]